jgi:hypothetical protein
MAVFCSKCGAEVAAGAQFCAACGTPVVVAAAPPAFTPVSVPGQTAPPPQQAVPAYIPPPPAPPKSNNSALKIILIVVAIFVGLGILGAGAFSFVVWRVAHSFHAATASNGTVTINTPGGGSFSTSGVKNFTADDLGADIYPGAQSTSGGMRMDMPGGSVVTGVFLTSDSKDAVVTFYKSKFGADASVFDSADSAVISLKKGEKESVMVTVSSRQNENDGKTKIAIVHTTNKSS